MASCFRNTCAKNRQNPLIPFKVTIDNVGVPFLRHSVVAWDRSRYLSFSLGSGSSEAGDRVVVLLHEMLANNKSFHQLWLVVQVLLLSHGQATCSRAQTFC